MVVRRLDVDIDDFLKRFEDHPDIVPVDALVPTGDVQCSLVPVIDGRPESAARR